MEIYRHTHCRVNPSTGTEQYFCYVASGTYFANASIPFPFKETSCNETEDIEDLNLVT